MSIVKLCNDGSIELRLSKDTEKNRIKRMSQGYDIVTHNFTSQSIDVHTTQN